MANSKPKEKRNICFVRSVFSQTRIRGKRKFDKKVFHLKRRRRIRER